MKNDQRTDLQTKWRAITVTVEKGKRSMASNRQRDFSREQATMRNL